jgi:hypothetical protein
MAAVDYPGFKADDSLTIWRYMSVVKLGNLAHGRLYFPAATQFEDPFEGAITEKDRLEREKRTGSGSTIPAFEELRRLTKISCWHASEHENIAMWERYRLSSKGTAVVASTVGSFKRSLRPFRLKSDFGEEVIKVGLVRYIDYATEEGVDRSMDDRFMYKRIQFRDENEVRALLPLRHAAQFGARVPEEGVNVDVDPEVLLDGVWVWPGATDEEIERVDAVVNSKGLACPVRRSTLSHPPTY